ncbi:MAG TPA: endonuclease/exonuclease/phosphatase family protein [Thermomicrobiales bacterium]|jgi:predicted extracellular nuclease
MHRSDETRTPPPKHRTNRQRRWSLAVACALIVAFAQGCWGGGPPAPPATATRIASATAAPPSATPTTSAATATRLASSPTRPEPPRATATATAPIVPTVTPTEPRLGLDPPGTPVRVGSPTATIQPTIIVSGREATIGQVQGTGQRSPLLGQTVRIKGVVTADFQEARARGFYVQEQAAPQTESSNGIFVFQGDRPTPDVKIGDEVMVIGAVTEASDRTQLDIDRVASSLIVNSSGNALPPPIELRPPALDADARAYLERYEGMLVSVPRAIAVGPTNSFGGFIVVRADTGATRLFGSEPRGAGWRIGVNDGGGGGRYEVAVGDQVDGLIGPLDYSFGQFTIAQLPEQKLVITAADRPPPSVAPAAAGEFTIASFNLENFFDPLDTPGKADPCDRDITGKPCPERVTAADYALKLTKAGQAIRDILGAPTLVAVQEVENIQVLSALATSPELAPFGYGVILLDGLDPRGINVGLLYRRDRVTVTGTTQRNACTTADLGFSGGEARCSTKGDGILDGYAVATRPPLVVSMVVRDGSGGVEQPLTVIVNHWKSKGGTDPAGQEFVGRRVAEAQLVAGIVNDLLAADPNAAIMVVGDLNDFVDSPPLRALTQSTPLRALATINPAAAHYSYIYNGLSQILDHILVTPNLRAALKGFAYAHLDADYPAGLAGQPNPYRVSDHDPPVGRFRLGQ